MFEELTLFIGLAIGIFYGATVVTGDAWWRWDTLGANLAISISTSAAFQLLIFIVHHRVSPWFFLFLATGLTLVRGTKDTFGNENNIR